MTRLFAVTNTRSAAWNNSLPMEEQEDWKAHAAFMDALQAEGFVVIGGPLEGTPDALLIIRANDAEEISSRLSEDPWRHKGLLTTTRVVPWTLRLGSLG
ncbi:MAG TPA: YciI family protein [Alphaproteobacteria bacterium]|nr:YciI family protein [Alphaproteobacteria bacterium]